MVTAAIYRRTAGAISVAAFVALAGCAQAPSLDANKRLATEFYDAAINRKDFAAASQYLGNSYKQHNPTAADGPDGLRAFIDFLKMRYPNQRGDIKRVIAEGDLVVARL